MLSLSAEQKTISRIFQEDAPYIIPEYQRQYSWKEEQCSELWEDLQDAYESNKRDGYFLGNIIIAKSKEDREFLEVIDGQQRLTTILLLLKALSLFEEVKKVVTSYIWINDRWTEEKIQRIVTNVFEERDSKFLKEVLSFDLEQMKNISLQRAKSNTDNFRQNIYFFYIKLKKYSEQHDLRKLTSFILDDVYLLPIQSEGSNKSNAREKALKIFETINDRGLSLTDSDIFKAQLYYMAQNELMQNEFMSRWTALLEDCKNIDYEIDEIFKIYTQIVRGENGIKGSEIGLREFFTQKEFSPFKKKKYNVILDDLTKIIGCIQYFIYITENPSILNELTKWFQLIKQYTNRYPLHALIVYLFINGFDDSNVSDLQEFTKNLVRLSYYKGSTTKIKNDIYEVVIKICHKEKYNYLPAVVKESDFEYFGLLKNGFALLAYYLDPANKAIFPFYFQKIITRQDINLLHKSWDNHIYEEYADSIGNLLVVDIPKKNISMEKKLLYVHSNSLVYNNDWTYQNYYDWNKKLLNRLIKFFNDDNNA